MFSQRIILILLFVSIQCLFNFSSPTTTLVTRLVHYLSVDSPTFEPNLSMIERSHLDLERSIVRASYVASISSNRFHLTDLETTIFAQTNAFFVQLKVGTPPVYQLVYMDTGSALFWIFCEPCTLNAPFIRFDPNYSTSFQKEYCISINGSTTDVCSRPSPVQIRCDGGSGRRRSNIAGCLYDIAYAKGFSTGYLAREKLQFGSDILDDIVFGCARNSDIIQANGVFGLRMNSLSFMGQRHSSKFGYCIGNISDEYDIYSRLLIGDEGVKLSGYTTPLIIQGQYYINLEEIMIGDVRLDIEPAVFRRNQNDYTGGLILDTGSAYTFFPQEVLDKIHEEIYWLIGSMRMKNSSITHGIYYLHCYHGVIGRDLIEFPLVQLKFENGAVMELHTDNVFHQFDNEVFCLAIIPSEFLAPGAAESKLSLLGNIMQQYFYMAYDLQEEVLAFKRMDCAQLAAA